MSAVNLLKAACLCNGYRGFKDLLKGNYVIDRFSLVDTNHGPRVRIDVNTWYMFLPERFSKFIKEENLQDLNAATVIMTYSGKDQNNRNRLMLDFDVISISEEDDELTAESILKEASA